MTGEATAIAHGAATIVNAIALGKGAAFGVNLWTKAQVKLTDEPHIVDATITSDPNESTVLIEKTVMRIFRQFNLENRYGAKVKTWSNIPIAKGLKSSSAAANAVALASVAAVGKTLDDLEVVKLGVDSAFDAKVTVTGAFDDACASYFGGVAITDNSKREVVKQAYLDGNLAVLFYVPKQKAYTANANVERLKPLKPLVNIAFEQSLKGNFWEALSLNGLIYSSALGFNPAVALEALEAGAIAAGLCGKGPAVTAVMQKEKLDSVKVVLQEFDGEIIEAQINHEKARVF